MTPRFLFAALLAAAVSLTTLAAPAFAEFAGGVCKVVDPKAKKADCASDILYYKTGLMHLPPRALKAGDWIALSAPDPLSDKAVFSALVDAPGAKPETPAPSSAAATGSSSDPELNATVKTYNAATRKGTLTPASGGRDLVFAVDPSVKAEIKPGSKVSYVEVVVTGVKQ